MYTYQLKIYFDHLLQGLKSPFSFVLPFQLENLEGREDLFIDAQSMYMHHQNLLVQEQINKSLTSTWLKCL